MREYTERRVVGAPGCRRASREFRFVSSRAAALVVSGYKERSHDLEALGAKAAEQHPLLADALPKTEPADKHLFDLLKKAYIEARYSQAYRITHAELSTLQGRVLELARRVREVSLEKLATFCGPDAVRTTLPEPPDAGEAFDVSLPSPPDDPAELTAWARSLSELAEARVREAYRRMMDEVQQAREYGDAREAKGLREGEAKGKAEGLRVAVLDLCELLAIVPTDEQRARLEAMGLDELEALRQQLKRARRWPN